MHGLLLVDKDAGMTSHDIVARLRKILSISAVGHCGTLDPLATGLMVMLIGNATKLSQYILEGHKSYEVKFRVGKRTDTFDSTGQVTEEKEVKHSDEEITHEALGFAGEFHWPVPIFSAVKVKGEKLYNYARKDQEVEIPMKTMKFWDIKFLGVKDSEFHFSIHCSKGSYIRSWVDQLGQKLGCGAHMTGLRRTGSVPFELAKSQTLAQISEIVRGGQELSSLISMNEALPQVKKISASDQDRWIIKNGQIPHGLRVQLMREFHPEKDQVIQIMDWTNTTMLALVGFDSAKGFVFRRVLI